MAYVLGARSLQKLDGVNPSLVRVVKRAIEITEQDFTVIEGLRSVERQRQLVRDGFSRTMNSKHLTGRAVDIVPYPIQSNWNNYTNIQWAKIKTAMFAAAKELGVSIVWGGDWKSFVDKPHYELR